MGARLAPVGSTLVTVGAPELGYDMKRIRWVVLRAIASPEASTGPGAAARSSAGSLVGASVSPLWQAARARDAAMAGSQANRMERRERTGCWNRSAGIVGSWYSVRVREANDDWNRSDYKRGGHAGITQESSDLSGCLLIQHPDVPF